MSITHPTLSPDDHCKLTTLQSRRPRPKPELGDVVLDEGWSTGGEESDGGQPPPLVDPHEDLKDPITGTKGISILTISDDEVL